MAGGIAIEQDAFGTPGVWRLTLTHTGKFNAMSRSMWTELRAVFTAVQQDASVRCVLLQGDRGHFCAGGDIAEYPSFRFDEAQLRHFHEQEVWGGLQAMLDCDVPIVARIEGNCMGAGMEISSCCDLRLASTQARFGAPIARLGFPMAPKDWADEVLAQITLNNARGGLESLCIRGPYTTRPARIAAAVLVALSPDIIALLRRLKLVD